MSLETARESGVPRILRWGLLVYEALRLAVLVRIMAGEAGEGEFPGIVYGAANALFLLMALFLLADLDRYGVYAPLYSAGKILSVLVLSSVGMFRRDMIMRSILARGIDFLYAVGGLAVIALGDVFSAICGVFLALRRQGAGRDSGRDSSLRAGDPGEL
ncbi:MAG: hypothetical protein LBH51_00940 [Treponema sp.]|jgi:hypothetical protein|nr:hypothetical protein [Treponema sp.]